MPIDLKKHILGLDLGTTSIGWALIEAAPNPTKIIDMGVRIFPEGMDRTRGEKSLNQDRRDARSLRRQGYRRVRRKENVFNALLKLKLLPKDQKQLDTLYQDTNPYELRVRALDTKLSPHELGRALYHLAQRRGYLSNRKTGTDKENGVVSESISEITTAMKENNYRTLGEFLFNLDPHQIRLRQRHTSRQMYLDEFEAIWREQKKHYPKILSEKHRRQVHKAIFFQRPLKVQKFLIGNCEFEQDRKRAMSATLAVQEFRMWQAVNNIKVLFADTGEERFLTDEERLKLTNKLATLKSLTWERIRKLLGFYDSTLFNLEKVRKSGLLGNQTAALLATAIGKKAWKLLSGQDREALTFDLLNIETDKALSRRLQNHWGFDKTQTEKLLKKSQGFAKGYSHLSHKAIKKILPHLKQVSTPDNKGINYAEACKRAGYHHSKKSIDAQYEALPFPGKLSKNDKQSIASLVQTSDLRNPMVERALFQIYKVVNAIIKEHGKPDIIRVEMARDLKSNSKQREKYSKQQKVNEDRNNAAEKAISEIFEQANIHQPPRYSDKIKYRLWQEANHSCIYCNNAISPHQLFISGEAEIEHIIPYSRCLDNSYMNKIVAHRRCNADKGNLMPWDAFSAPQYAEILQRIKKLPYPKRKRFSANFLISADGKEKDFVSQQLNETRYISKKAVEYLQQLKDVKIEPVKGGTTALLRNAWGLNFLLAKDGEKNRMDHRHHAVDALVVAMTDIKAVRRLNTLAKLTLGRLRVDDYPVPMPDLRQKARKASEKIIISHKTLRKLRGALHDETLYAISDKVDKRGVPIIAIRKNLADLKPKDLEKIKDPRIKKLALEHLKASDNDFKLAFKDDTNHFGFYTKKGNFQRIKKVRLEYSRSVQPIASGHRKRHVWTRSNHHIEIIQKQNKQQKEIWEGHVISTLDSAIRQKTGDNVIKTDHGKDCKFVMALHINDMVKLKHEGEEIICRVEKMDQSGSISLRKHNDADKEDYKLAIRKRPNTLKTSEARLIKIDLLGKIKE